MYVLRINDIFWILYHFVQLDKPISFGDKIWFKFSSNIFIYFLFKGKQCWKRSPGKRVRSKTKVIVKFLFLFSHFKITKSGSKYMVIFKFHLSLRLSHRKNSPHNTKMIEWIDKTIWTWDSTEPRCNGSKLWKVLMIQTLKWF